jgi:hypothetical protein
VNPGGVSATQRATDVSRGRRKNVVFTSTVSNRPA